MSQIVQIRDVHKEYPLGKVTVHALRGVTLDIDVGDFVTIAALPAAEKRFNQIGCVDIPTRG